MYMQKGQTTIRDRKTVLFEIELGVNVIKSSVDVTATSELLFKTSTTTRTYIHKNIDTIFAIGTFVHTNHCLTAIIRKRFVSIFKVKSDFQHFSALFYI